MTKKNNEIKTNAGKPRKKLKIVDSIKLKLNAKMEDVTVKIENDVREIAALEVCTVHTPILKSFS
jgi:hypothetical protein